MPGFVPVRTFLQVLGFIYFIAFTSFGKQAPGLIGSHGIVPFQDFLNAVRSSLGSSGYWQVPSVLWLHPTDGALRTVWILGAAAALVAIFAPWKRTALAVCLVLWVSICSIGQDFLSFQWDVLLSEAGFLAIFADNGRVRVWLFRWLLFRLMFFSGVVKLASHDETWRNLTALSFHYWTQPLPTPLAWLAEQLPRWSQKISTAMVFVIELAVPFLFFAPRKLRLIGAWATVGLQILILATGNYTFFNFLAIALVIWLIIEPVRSSPVNEPVPPSPVNEPIRAATVRERVLDIFLVVIVGLISALLFLQLFSVPLPPGGAEVLHLAEPFRIVNSYGLFAVMTTSRAEIIVEGSDDGLNWKAYEFPYKPGNVLRAPPVIQPDQPRLDWQMWFAALGSYQENRWFVNFLVRLLQGEPAVLRLLQYNPFPKAPPKYIRARSFLYHFTKFGERGWWTRQEQGIYFPPVSLK